MNDQRRGRAPRFRPAYLFALLAIGPAAAVACGSSDAASTASQAQSCHQNSDCATGLICALGGCRTACTTAADCSGGSCITDGRSAVCQPAAEKNTPCDRPSDCPVPLACASDYRCRNLCQDDADCNVLGISGRECAKDAQGVLYCADPSEVSAEHLLIATPPVGHADGPVQEPAGSGGTVDGGGTNPGADGGAGGDGSTSGADGASSEASVCATPCGPGSQCVNSACAACGGSGQVCCGGDCGTGLSCVSGTCGCGTPGAACCGGTACTNGVTCVSGTCACGAAGQACCPATGAGAPETCNGTLSCAGKACGCIKGLVGYMAQRSDGALYDMISTTTPILSLGGGPFVATSFAFRYNDHGCGVQADGTVSCFNTGGTTGNSYGQLGNGTTTGGATPSAVVDANGTSLKNIKTVAVGLYAGCAADTSGNMWCWGRGPYGELGNGATNNSMFAVQVLNGSGGGQFTGVAQIAISDSHVCALKTDGSLWCWGENNVGQLGNGSTTGASYPQQVSALFKTVTQVIAFGTDTCATTNDGGVYCWGYGPGYTLGNGTADNQSTPSKVLSAGAGSAAFTGVRSITATANGVYALKTDGSIMQWGNSQYSAPVAYTESNFPITGASLLSSDGSYISFLGSDAAMHAQGGPIPNPLTCP